MITIDVKTKAVTISNRYDRDYRPMARNKFGDASFGYVRCHLPPNYPMPAIRTEIDYYRQWPSNNVVAVVLFNVSDPNIPCLEFWH